MRKSGGVIAIVAALAVAVVGFVGVARASAATFLPSDLLGQTDYNSYDIVPASPQSTYGPSDTAVDSLHHRLFVSDGGNSRILIFNLDANNTLIDHTADAVLGKPDLTTGGTAAISAHTLDCGFYCGIAYDSARNLLFVSDRNNYRVLVFDVSTITNNEDAIHVLGQQDFTTKACQTTQKGMCSPTAGLTYDADNHRLFVPETNGKRVLVFDISTISDYMNASYVLGQPDFTSSGNNGVTDTSLQGLVWAGVAFDPDTQRLFVTDNSDNRIMVFDVTPGTITNGEAASYVLGQPDFTTATPGTTANTLDAPQGIGWDSVHRQLFVAEYNNCRVSVFDTDSLSNGEAASAVLGQPDLTTNTCLSTPPTIESLVPDAINMGMDAAHHRLYFGDAGNNRVLVFDFARITSTTLTSGATGSAYSGAVTTAGTQGSKNFSITSGALPPGLTLNAATGELTGTPTTTGTYHFTVRLVDTVAGSLWDSAEQTLSITEGAATGTDHTGGTTGSANKSPTTSAAATNASENTSASSNETASPTTEPDGATFFPEPKAFLNETSGYLDGGTSLTLSKDESVTFCAEATTSCSQNNRYVFRLANIDVAANSVDLTLSPSNRTITLVLQKPQTIDANNDSKPDIRATLTALTENNATISFQTVKTTHNNDKVPTDTANSKAWVVWTAIAAAVALAILSTLRILRRR